MRRALRLLGSAYELACGCRHKNYTFPRTVHGCRHAHYVVCLDCSRELPYDWSQMRIVETEAA